MVYYNHRKEKKKKKVIKEEERMKKYGVVEMNLSEFLAENEKSERESYDFSYDWVLNTSDISEIKAFLEGKDLNQYCIEEYNADEDGEFMDGSNYDSAENFMKGEDR